MFTGMEKPCAEDSSKVKDSRKVMDSKVKDSNKVIQRAHGDSGGQVRSPTTLHASHRCENDRAICIRRAQFKNKQTGVKKAHYLLSINSTHPASSQPCILSTLCHLSTSINSPSYHPCILSILHCVIHIYQPCIILSMHVQPGIISSA